MAFKSQLNKNYWYDSKQLYFSAKLSLEGKNMLPHIVESNCIHVHQDQPFLHVLKKPIMSLYERVQFKLERKPVCIIGMPKDVEARNTKTGGLKRNSRAK